MSKTKVILQFFFGIPLTIISFYFIFSVILRYQSTITPYFKKVNLATLALGLIFFFGYFVIRAIIWKKIMKGFGYDLDMSKSAFSFFFSESRRYIPGNIFSILSRIQVFNNLQIPIKTITKGLFVEAFLLLVSGFTIGVIALSSFQYLFASYFEKFSTLFLRSIFLAVTGVIFLILLILLLWVGKKVKQKMEISFRGIFRFRDAFYLSFIGWILYGIGNYFITISFTYLDPLFFLQFISIFVFSWFIGYIAVVTPMGLGVREAAVALGLSPFVSLPVSSALAILLRIMLITAELTVFGVSYLIYKASLSKKITRLISLSWQEMSLAILIFSYICYFTYISFEKHINYFTGRFDLGNMVQTIWNTLHGRVFILTNPDGINITSRLAIHADFILILLTPLYALWQDPRVLLFTQTVVIGMGAYFVYKIAEAVSRHKTLSLILAVSYLLNPFIQKQNLYDFHPITLATTFLLITYYFLLKKNYILFAVFIFLSVLTKENVYLIAALFGIIFFIQGKKLFGGLLACASTIIFYIIVAKVIPQARGGEHFAIEYYNYLGNSPSQIIKNSIFQPTLLFSTIITFKNLEYLKNLLLPVGFISLLSPSTLFLAVPDFLLNILSKNENLRSINFHYSATVIPFVYISASFAIKKILTTKIPPRIIGYYLLATSILSTFYYGTLPGARMASLEMFREKPLERNDVKGFIKTIPKGYRVAATNNLGAHLSDREYIYTIPYGIEQADMVIFLLNDIFAQPSPAAQEKLVEQLKLDPRFNVVHETGKFVVFERKK